MAKSKEDDQELRPAAAPGLSFDGQTLPVVRIDYEKYERLLEGADITEEDRREFIETMWSIICEFVALGFGVHPVQQAQKTCGKDANITGKLPAGAVNTVEYKERSLARDFASVVDSVFEEAAEGFKR